MTEHVSSAAGPAYPSANATSRTEFAPSIEHTAAREGRRDVGLCFLGVLADCRLRRPQGPGLGRARRGPHPASGP